MAQGKLIKNFDFRTEDQKLLGEADLYRKALEKAAYGAVGPAFSQGLQGISGYLSHAGPLADSGARAALSARLASGLYGGAARQVAGGYSDYLSQALRDRRQFQYQLALQKAQKKAQQTGLGGVLGGIAGTVLGGPFGGAAGTWLGNQVFGSGGSYGSDPYNLFNYNTGSR